jgi:hypothetical protein
LTARYWGHRVLADRGLRIAAAWFALLGGSDVWCQSQEIGGFRLTGVEGYASVRYLRDDFVTGQPAAAPGADSGRSRQSQFDLREELFVMTHSYVYHPSFLTLDIGAGPILQRSRFATDAGEAGSSGTLYNLTSRATVLRDKPYRGSVYFDHLNPTLNVAPGEVLTTENTRYGIQFSLLAPVTPVPLHLDAEHVQFQGRGASRIMDDRVDRIGLRANRSFGALGSTQVQYQSTQQESSSGSPNLPIQATTSSNHSFSVDSRLQFGATRQYDLTNLITLNTQAYTLDRNSMPDRKDLRVLLDVRGRHTRQVNTFATYNYSSSAQGELTSIIKSASAGLNYWPSPEFGAAFGMRADDSQTRQLSARSQGLDGSVRYQQQLPVGVAQFNYGLRHDQRDQQATGAQTNVIGERITLAGTTVYTLTRAHVTAGSIVVSSASRTQTFLEGRDYVLSAVGSETRLQRLVGGNIFDGQEVLVDYAYEVGGTFASTQTDQTLNINWGLLSYFSVYFRRFDSTPHLSSGTPAFPLNEIQSTLYGARADVPLRLGLEAMAGGSIEQESRRETIAPYRRHSSDLYAQVEDPVLAGGNIRISTRRAQMSYENSLQNMNLVGYDIRYWTRRWFGIDLSAVMSRERDDGGPLPRRREDNSAKAQWRYRKLSLSLDVSRARESQGAFERTRALVQFIARRDF